MRTRASSCREMMPPEVASRILRLRYFYKVEIAGLQIGYSRTQGYLAARAGVIPTERYGKLLLVPRQKWDRKATRLLHGLKRSRRKRARAGKNVVT